MWRVLVSIPFVFSVILNARASPPWSKGANDPAAAKGFVFHVDDVDNVLDRDAALAWLAYLKSEEAQTAYAEFGFKPYVEPAEK